MAEKHPDEGPANLERVCLFYEIERSRKQLVDSVTAAVHTSKCARPMRHAQAELGPPLVSRLTTRGV
ncbi:MAG: hypothetical protein ACXVHQ_34320 [Solirubrobacteraceae bacterium]